MLINADMNLGIHISALKKLLKVNEQSLDIRFNDFTLYLKGGNIIFFYSQPKIYENCEFNE